MAALTVRDPAVDRSLRSVFGKEFSGAKHGEGIAKGSKRRGTPPSSHESTWEPVMAPACRAAGGVAGREMFSFTPRFCRPFTMWLES